MRDRYIAVRDKRLMGGVPAHANLTIINTDKSTPLRTVFHQINACARAGRINTLFVLCHGYAGANLRLNVSADAGGMGLQLGKEGVMHANVGQWTHIKNNVDNIVVYACAAADTEPGNEGSKADGRYLMGALALVTNADVYAADRIQWYQTYNGMKIGAYDFGTWEGNVYKFPANSGQGAIVAGPPVELTMVLGGRAP
jgi:hypothetical protein